MVGSFQGLMNLEDGVCVVYVFFCRIYMRANSCVLVAG
jgi:hypothetical protein